MYSFGELTEDELQYKEEFIIYIHDIYALNCNTINSWSIGADYYMNIEERLFYKISDNDSEIERRYVNGSIKAWGNYIINRYENEDYDTVYVTNRDGMVLYESVCHNIAVSGEYLVLYTETGFVVVNKDFTERAYPVELKRNDSFNSGSVFIKFDGNLVFYIKDFWDNELYSVDEAGNVLKTAVYDEPAVYVKEDYTYKPIYYKDDVYYLQDADGNILLSYQRTENEPASLRLRGKFVILDIWDGAGGMSASQRTVYSIDRTLLIDEIYGIADSPAPFGGIFVYTTPDNCIILYPNGDTVLVSAAPMVKKISN